MQILSHSTAPQRERHERANWECARRRETVQPKRVWKRTRDSWAWVDISCTNTLCISDGGIHLVQSPMCRWRMTATDDRHEQGFVRGQTRWASISSRHAGENHRVRVDWAERDRCTHRDLWKKDGRLDSVSLYTAGPTADFLELDAQERQDDEYDQQGNLLNPIKVKEGTREDIDGVFAWKANARNDKTDLPHWNGFWRTGEQRLEHDWLWERSRMPNLKTRSSKRVILFSAVPPVESLKALVNHVMAERVGRRGTKFGGCSVRRVKSTLFTVCANANVYVEPPTELHRPGLS